METKEEIAGQSSPVSELNYLFPPVSHEPWLIVLQLILSGPWAIKLPAQTVGNRQRGTYCLKESVRNTNANANDS